MQQDAPHKILGYKSKILPSLQIIGAEDLSSVSGVLERREGKVIGTHSGQFHCDEVLATTLLLYTTSFGAEKNPVIIRTRNEEILEKLDLICDVGSVFDPEKMKFDHHQKSFDTIFHNETEARKQQLKQGKEEEKEEEKAGEQVPVKLSSAGLIYRYFGKEVIKNILKEIWNVEYSEEQLQKIYDKLYSSFILEIDAIDNGVNQHPQKLRYNISSHLSSRIAKYNKPWNAPKDVDQQERFKMAMKATEEEFISQLNSIAMIHFPARMFCEQAWAKKEEIHPSGSFVYLENFCPWGSHMGDLEVEHGQPEKLNYVIFKDERGMFRIQSVSDKASFSSRAPLAQAWRGLRGKELQEVSGIPDLEFVHHAGFIGGAWSFESVLKMGEISLKELQQKKEAGKETPKETPKE